MEVLENKITKFREGLAQTNLPFRDNLLKTAEETLNTLDFPTTRVERWKYTRTNKIASTNFFSRKDVVSNLELPLTDAYNLVFVNGYLNTELSSKNFPAGVEITSIEKSNNEVLGSKVAIETEVFTALNTLYATDGASIRI